MEGKCVYVDSVQQAKDDEIYVSPVEYPGLISELVS
jgi:hypothetical protein